MSLAFSAIITTGALVLPETSVGMIEQSTTRKPGHAVHAQPVVDDRHARRAPSLHVPDGWKIVAPYSRANSSSSSSLVAADPGRSPRRHTAHRAVAASARANSNARDRAAPVQLGGRGSSAASPAARAGPRTCDAHVAARCRSQLAHAERESRKRMRLGAGQVRRQRGEVELDVRRRVDSGSARVNSPPWLMPTASGPVRRNSHCSPICSRPPPRCRGRRWS